MKIPLARPFFGPEELLAVQKPIESGWVVQGPFVAEFEAKFSQFTGSAFSVATSSCTTALHASVAALGLRPGDEVIVPAFTWVATANVVEYMGAKPVFCDVDLDTFNIVPSLIEPLITSATVGIIPVHLFGLCADMEPILRLASVHGLWVVEDAACAFGSSRHGQQAGLFGDIGCFSFHPRKSITTGEGGMVTTQRADLATLCRELRDHGLSTSTPEPQAVDLPFLLPDVQHLGYNYRMTDIQGAIGCAQLDKASWILDQRRRIARSYDEDLATVSWLRTPLVPEEYIHSYQAYVCLFAPEEPTLANVDELHDRRNALMSRLQSLGIGTRPGTHAPVTLRYYAERYGLRKELFPNAYLADRLSFALPLYAQLTESEAAAVCTALRASFSD